MDIAQGIMAQGTGIERQLCREETEREISASIAALRAVRGPERVAKLASMVKSAMALPRIERAEGMAFLLQVVKRGRFAEELAEVQESMAREEASRRPAVRPVVPPAVAKPVVAAPTVEEMRAALSRRFTVR